MRQLRILGQGVWYEVRTRINNREPLFHRVNALAIFAGVFHETELRFVFEVRGLRLEDDRLMFYIRPEDGLELPDIMKWMKQVFAQRFNVADGRTGHIWGDRYWSRIVEGEPEVGEPPGEEVEGLTNGDRPCRGGSINGDRPRWKRREEKSCFSLLNPFPAAPTPG
jgi:hypothetical protein